MKKKEIKKLSKTEALKNVDKLKKDLFNMRFKKINGQVNNPAQFSLIKRSIARLYTSIKNTK